MSESNRRNDVIDFQKESTELFIVLSDCSNLRHGHRSCPETSHIENVLRSVAERAFDEAKKKACVVLRGEGEEGNEGEFVSVNEAQELIREMDNSYRLEQTGSEAGSTNSNSD